MALNIMYYLTKTTPGKRALREQCVPSVLKKWRADSPPTNSERGALLELVSSIMDAQDGGDVILENALTLEIDDVTGNISRMRLDKPNTYMGSVGHMSDHYEERKEPVCESDDKIWENINDAMIDLFADPE